MNESKETRAPRQPSAQGNLSIKERILQDEQLQVWLLICGLLLVLIYGFFNTLSEVAATWTSPQYSHGYLIPVFTAVLLWLRREPFSEVSSKERWLGVGLIAASIVVRTASSYYVTFTFDRLAFIPCVAGVFLLAGGWKTLRWSAGPIAFLVFMLPWPDMLVTNILHNLQGFATKCSLFAMQTLGVEAYGDGNLIILDQQGMNVADACSGLRMLTIFLALSVAVAMLMTNRPAWERIVIVVSAIPIALTVNIFRITVTGLLYNLHVKAEIANMIFHDLAGWVMMPMALGLLYLEYQVLSRLLIEDAPPENIPINLTPGIPLQQGRNRSKPPSADGPPD